MSAFTQIQDRVEKAFEKRDLLTDSLYRDAVLETIEAIDRGELRVATRDAAIADPRKARSVLGWEPSVNFKELATLMVDADIKRLSQK